MMNLPEPAKKFYQEVYDSSKNKGLSNSTCMEIAWSAVKSKLKKVDDGWVALSEDFEDKKVFVFELKIPELTTVMNGSIEEILLEGVLATTDKNNEGQYFELEDLEYIAKQINEEESSLPDSAHVTLAQLKKEYPINSPETVEFIRKELIRRKGAFKNIRAIVNDGSLWIQAHLDKRYNFHKDNFKGLSIEALGYSEESGRVRKPRYLGFTFTNSPKLASARIVS